MGSTRFRTTVLSVAVAGALPAQTNISGIVHDSLVGGPFRAATVQLVPAATPWAAGRSVTTDATGKFLLPNVAAGRYLFGFQHPRLDSLGLDAVSRTLDVPTATPILRADLALPSAKTFAATLCGSRADSTGALVGRVMNADDGSALAAGSVLVRWAELRVDAGGVRRVPAQVVATFGSDGRYVACGVPTDAPLQVRARLARAPGDSSASALPSSGEIQVQFAARVPLLHRDFLIATSAGESVVAANARGVRAGTARLAGRITGADRRGTPGARISLRESDVVAVTDSSGAFRLAGLPAGTRGIEVTAVGYVPTQLIVDLRPGRDVTVNATIVRSPVSLDSVRVAAATGDRSGFQKRRAAGTGYFLDAAALDARGSLNVASALTGAPSLRVNGMDAINPSRPLISGRGRCDPTVFVDGQPMRDGLAGADDLLTIRRVGGIEVYANPADAPPQFAGAGARAGSRNTTSGCAVIVIWTKAYVP